MILTTHFKLQAALAGLSALAIIGAPSGHAQAAEVAEVSEVAQSATPEEFVDDLVEKLRILAGGDASEDERVDQLRDVLAEDMAVRRLQRYLLSNEQRKSLSKDDIAQYNALFPRYISTAVASSIDQLVSREIKVFDVTERRPGDFIVSSNLFSDTGEKRARIDWRVQESRGRKQLTDVMIDGASTNVDRRAQFNAIINKDGFPALIEHMRDVTGETAS